MAAETLQEAVERADQLVRSHPEIAGAQVQPNPTGEVETIH